MERYFNGKANQLDLLLSRGTKVLDAGCGSGFSALLLFRKHLNDIYYLGADISNSVDIAKMRFEEAGCHGEFIQADLTKLPFSEPKFDVIFSEGVLHHTDSTEKAIKYLTTLLIPGGHFLFYVYKTKAPIREFTDDYVRNQLINMDDSQAWNELRSLTLLGKILGDLNIEVEIPEPILLLGIPAGRINIQRLFYWYICKAFYNPEWTIDEMNHVNFDWYRPLNCHRHTPEEIMTWCNQAGLKIERMNVQEAGITVVAKKE
ncbi:class I SAM-dependent methyltransferase [Syntrophomonas wolfei]|nr:class I SAM-dependent methyltransferase [Syntrophomonas wolfei]